VSDYEETTYADYEVKLLKESISSIAMSVIISLVMSFKFQVHMSLMIQSIMLPMNLIDNPCIKKYALGLVMKQSADDLLYGESFSAPTEASLLAAAKAKALAEGQAEPPAAATAATTPEPRVVELPSEEKPKTTAAADLD